EDMGFDSVIVDEGHNYRNSYKNGREASQLAYLPTSAVAQSARDMAIKNAYLMKKNGGRGPVLLTATPVVNTPIDAYNMLSHVLPKEYWQKMGIYSPDDFVKFFGKTRLETVQKISGEVEEKMALVGFENLDALRGIFHRWTTLKTAEDVKDTVEIPELDEHQQDAPLTEEQLAAYEELRQQAEAAAKANNGVTTSVNEDGV
ncbi:TPA: helicase, partial [Escherichia coli]|nr:helicase [Escherichia coli]